MQKLILLISALFTALCLFACSDSTEGTDYLFDRAVQDVSVLRECPANADSGAACYEVNGERKSCLLAGDEARHACFFRIDGQTIVPGPSIKLFPHKENNVAMSEADIEGVSFRTAITT